MMQKRTHKHEIKIPVLFCSTTRLGAEPDPTLVKKWVGLKPYFDATVLSFRSDAGPLKLELEGATWLLLPPGLPRPLRYVLYFCRAFWLTLLGALTNKYRAVITQSPYEAVAPALALLPWRLVGAAAKPKLIVEIHNDWTEGVLLYHRSRLTWLERPLRKLVGTFSLSQADSYRAISDFCRALLPQNGKPVFVFPTYTDLESFKAPSEALVRELAAARGTGYFLFVGMLIYLKGVHHLLKAFGKVHAAHPAARLIIAGKGDQEVSLKQLADDLGVADVVRFVGHLDQDTLAAYIKNAGALLMPSLTEGLGRVAIEAHLLERPVIGSRTGGIPEIVADGTSGILCEPGDEHALQAAMERLLQDRQEAERMGAAGREAVTQKFDYRTYYCSYGEMVAKTVEGGERKT
ncbi:MAG: glycosyltransferase family 4 protein [Deltaproteobacteria bacterium]|nr:glycosyltransferase family 4 protein [Deltaproteobacteria bacterium]